MHRNFFEKWKELLKETFSTAGKDEYAYDDLVSDITELFLSGEKMALSLGSSSKSLTTLFWNLRNWCRGENWMVPSFVDYDNLYYKENHQGTYPDQVPEDSHTWGGLLMLLLFSA